MRVGYPVIFIRNGREFAGIVATSSPKDEQPPVDGSERTQAQALGELRCSIAFWDVEIRGWRQADDVPYLGIHLPVPAEGDFYSEAGAPDPQERAAEAADRDARMARLAGAELAADDPRRSPDPVDEQPATSADRTLEESIDDSLDQEARDRQIEEGAPPGTGLAEEQGKAIAAGDARGE